MNTQTSKLLTPIALSVIWILTGPSKAGLPHVSVRLIQLKIAVLRNHQPKTLLVSDPTRGAQKITNTILGLLVRIMVS